MMNAAYVVVTIQVVQIAVVCPMELVILVMGNVVPVMIILMKVLVTVLVIPMMNAASAEVTVQAVWIAQEFLMVPVGRVIAVVLMQTILGMIAMIVQVYPMVMLL